MAVITSSVQPLTVPQTKVSVRHEVQIIWPDGEMQDVVHLQDVTALFKDPKFDGRHQALVARLHADRVNAKMDFRMFEPDPDIQPDRQTARRSWLNRMFGK